MRSSGIGSYMSGKQGTALSADNINIKAKSQTHSERSDNHSKGVNAGVTVNYGSDGFAFGVTAGGNYGKGYGNGDELTWASSRVGDKNSKTSITSKNNTAIVGSRLQGKKVNITAKNLNIESLQDSMTYQGKQKGISAQATAGYGFTAGSNFNKSEIGADYLSVTKQSGVLAGDDGFEVNLTGKAKLTGAAIVSLADKSKNRLVATDFEYFDLNNYSQASAKSQGFSGGFSYNHDQTSQEDKDLNKKYRQGRDKETFNQANLNQANASKLKFGLGASDVHGADNYALAKVLAGNLLNQDRQSEHRSNVTQSIISEGNFDIGSQSGQQQITAISKGKRSDYSALTKVDEQALLEEAKANQSVKGTFINKVAGYTDEAYRDQFIAEHRMMSFVTNEDGTPIEDPEIIQAMRDEAIADGISKEDEIMSYRRDQETKGRNIYKLRELSDQERNHLEKITYIDPNTGKERQSYVVGFNGIFNDIQSSAKFAVQNYVASKDEEGNLSKKIYKNMYFVSNPKTNNPISELMVAGYHKVLEGRVAGLSNSGLQAIDLIKQYGKDNLFLGSHSRSTIVLDNTLRVLNTQENRDKAILSGTTLKMVGVAGNLERTNQNYKELSGEHNNSIRVEGHKGDIVHELVGGNKPTHNVNEHENSLLKIIYDIFAGDSSPHNCLGLGQVQCQKDGYRKGGKLIMRHEETVDSLYNTQKDTK